MRRIRHSFFKEKFGIERISSVSTLCCILQVLDPKDVSDAIVKIMKQHIVIVDEILAVDGNWSGIKSIFSVRRISEETRYYVTSLDVSPEKLLQISRDH